MQTFAQLNLPDILVDALAALKISEPTPIQAQTIPLAINGRDILGTAQTGTGKTLAFTLPMITKILNSADSQALILVPTRELAQQVLNSIRDLFGNGLNLKTALLIGGDPMFKQLKNLKSYPRIIVGTPGRVIDHLKRGTFRTNNIQTLVLDEMDRMFDMGFGIQIEEIIKSLPKERQTLMFSATISKQVAKLASHHMQEPERVAIDSVSNPVSRIQQKIVKVAEGDKFKELLTEIESREGSIIVFVKTKSGTENLAEKLERNHYTAEAIHGDLRQSKRQRVIASFRNGEYRIMVATDIAARGIDIPHIQHVINYDLPQCPEDYIHRIGRTARAGAEGHALCLITPQDGRKWRAIQMMMNPGEKLPPEPANRPTKKPYGKPSFGKPAFGKPANGKSGFGKPAFGKAAYGKPEGERGEGSRSEGGKPSFGKPAFGKPSNGKPAYGKPAFGKPAFGKPAFGKPAFGKPAFGKSENEKGEGGRGDNGKRPKFQDKDNNPTHKSRRA